jgi:hypothetical protein
MPFARKFVKIPFDLPELHLLFHYSPLKTPVAQSWRLHLF